MGRIYKKLVILNLPALGGQVQHDNIKYMNDQTCEECFRIACKKCDWVASDEEVLQVQKQILTACPQCGWQPSWKK